MTIKIFLISILISISILTAGCPADETSNVAAKNGSNDTAPTPQTTANLGEFGDEKKTPAPEVTIEAVNLKPVVEAYCEAMRKKDEAGLRKVYSQATLKSFEADMLADGVKTLVELLSTEPVGDKCLVANERIQGSLGEALVTTKTYPNGVMIKFVKENNEWKMTDQSADFDAVTKGAKK